LEKTWNERGEWKFYTTFSQGRKIGETRFNKRGEEFLTCGTLFFFPKAVVLKNVQQGGALYFESGSLLVLLPI
jgi:hypothetical protein